MAQRSVPLLLLALAGCDPGVHLAGIGPDGADVGGAVGDGSGGRGESRDEDVDAGGPEDAVPDERPSDGSGDDGEPADAPVIVPCVDLDGDGYGAGADCPLHDCDDAMARCTSDCSDDDGSTVADCMEWASLTAGADHTCAATGAGELWCWGANAYAELGLGDREQRYVPQRVPLEDDVVEVVGGDDHTCAVTAGGALYCWGANPYAQLGLGDRRVRERPERVPLEGHAVGVALGSDSTCAVTRAGALWCWGANQVGQLGVRTDDTVAETPQLVASLDDVAVVAAAGCHACAATRAGELYCWGCGTAGCLGLGDTENRRAPERVDLDEVTSVAAGTRHACAMRAGGELYCWGANGSGQLGLGDTELRLLPARVATLERVVAASASRALCDTAGCTGLFTCAPAEDGHYCWGANTYGQLGIGGRDRRLLPERVGGLDSVTLVAAGTQHSCAVAEHSRIFCWGAGGHGQLGVGDRAVHEVPVEVVW